MKPKISREDERELSLLFQKCVMHVSRLIFSDVSAESLFRSSFTSPGSRRLFPPATTAPPQPASTLEAGVPRKERCSHCYPQTHWVRTAGEGEEEEREKREENEFLITSGH